MTRRPEDPFRVLLSDRVAERRQRSAEPLRTHGFDVTDVDTPAEADLLLGAQRFDALVVDVSPPDAAAREVIRSAARRAHLQIAAVSELPDEIDRILVLDWGADEYLVRPFSPRLLVAHMQAFARRRDRLQRPLPIATARFAGWSVDLSGHIARRGELECRLTHGETLLLQVLLERPGAVLSRAELMALTHRDEGQVFDRAIDVMISRLRAKFAGDADGGRVFETIRGGGYRLNADVHWLD
jgi:DNA-binding response OmpR family regulator